MIPRALIVARGRCGATVSTGFVEQAHCFRDAAEPASGLAISLSFLALNGDQRRQDILPTLGQTAFAGLRWPIPGAFAYVQDRIARALENPATRKAVA